MNDHTFEQREITAMYRDRKKWEKISSPYDEDLLKDGWVCV